MCTYTGNRNPSQFSCEEIDELNGQCVLHAEEHATRFFAVDDSLRPYTSSYTRDFAEFKEQYDILMQRKAERISEKIQEGDFDFKGLRYLSPYDEYHYKEYRDRDINIYGKLVIVDKEIDGDVDFSESRIEKLELRNCNISGVLNLGNANIGEIVLDNVSIRNERYSDRVPDTDEANAFLTSIEENISINLRYIFSRMLAIDDCLIQGDILLGRWDPDRYPPLEVEIRDTKLDGYLFLSSALTGRFDFSNSKFNRGILYLGSTISGWISFNRAFIGDIYEITLSRWAMFDADDKTEASFHGTKFADPAIQEKLCRKARRLYEEQGNREEADYHYYREMEARRKQKNRLINYLELPFQYIFRYGTQWKYILALYLGVVIVAAILFWKFHGIIGATSFFDCLYFTFITITTLGYGDMLPASGWFRLLAIFLAVFGTFIWAALIAIFARKYMR
jgi:hypothetical protein